jgi:hypothetical protein
MFWIAVHDRIQKCAKKLFDCSFYTIWTEIFCMVVMLFSHADAEVFLYNIDTLVEGSTPLNSGPWLTASFMDTGENKVQLKLSGPGLTGKENVRQWYFNADQSVNPASLHIKPTFVSSGTPIPAVQTNVKGFSVENGGYYTIQITFPASDSGQFTADSSVIFDITSTEPLKASLFNVLKIPQDSKTSYYTAAQILGVGENGKDNAWIGSTTGGAAPVPEPSMYFIITSFIAMAIFIRYRRQKERKRI